MTKYETEIFYIDSESHHDLESAIKKVIELEDGWINLEPAVDENDQNEVPGFFAWFSARGPKVPVGTFVPGNKQNFASVGIAHGSGRGASDQLEELGIKPPESWISRQDHAKHGLVWEISPSHIVPSEVVSMILQGTVGLSTVPTTGGWTAILHYPPE